MHKQIELIIYGQLRKILHVEMLATQVLYKHSVLNSDSIIPATLECQHLQSYASSSTLKSVQHHT